MKEHYKTMEFTGTSGVSITFTIPQVKTFTMFELSNVIDCKVLHNYLIKKGLQNISPLIKGERNISFCGKIAKKYGSTFIRKLQELPADWLVLSGHHGILYQSDYNNFSIDPMIDPSECYNTNKYAGFFNNDYHHGRWSLATQDNPENGKLEGELYCSTTIPAPSEIAPFPQTNPYIPEETELLTALKDRCKGIILSGCNTLSYYEVRKNWVKHFPDAVIFGSYGRIKTGLHIIQSLITAPSTTKEFWLNPQGVLDSSSDMPEQIYRDVFLQGLKREIIIGMIYKKEAYIGNSRTKEIKKLKFDFLF